MKNDCGILQLWMKKKTTDSGYQETWVKLQIIDLIIQNKTLRNVFLNTLSTWYNFREFH